MREAQAKQVAKGLSLRGLEVGTEQTGGDVWVVTVERPRDKHLIVITDEIVAEYRARRHWDSHLPPIKELYLTDYGKHL